MRLPAPSLAFPVWLIDAHPSHCGRLLPLLTAAEQDRAHRFRTQDLRRRYIAAHSALRLLGEHYFGFPAASPGFEASELGKPRLWGADGPHCSISYSGSHAVVALATGEDLGLDVEAIRPIEDASELMEMHYTRRECEVLRQFPPASPSFDEGFLTVWVRKEACVKALGRGLDIPLDSFECGVGMGVRTVHAEGRAIRTGVFQGPHHLLVAWARCL